VTALLDRARQLADDLLYPAAAEVDATGVIPPSHFVALAEAGLYGVATEAPAVLPAITEVLAGACLATTFVWMQHHGPVRTLAASTPAALRERWLDAAVAGRVRCGVALAGGVPDPPLLWATREAGGWRLEGRAPLVTGWGLIDLVQVAARDTATADVPDDAAVIVTALLDAREEPGLTVRPLALLAAQASSTVELQFDDVRVPDERVAARPTRSAFLAGMTASSRVNGALALGVAGRCVRLIAETGRAPAVAERLAEEVDAARSALDAALDTAAPAPGSQQCDIPPTQPQQCHIPPTQSQQCDIPPTQGAGLQQGGTAGMAAARAAASELAHRAAGALVTAAGSRAILDGHPAGRLLREAAFTLVAAGRDEIRTDLLTRLTA
jgi:alkylation response protein AidB-like acyl-CoA dehydrogenase